MTLACDSGGSKTLLHIYNKDELIEEYHLLGVAAALDSQEDLPELRKHLNIIKEKYPIKAIAFNLGGRNKTQIERLLQSIFPQIPFRVFRESEGVAALALASRCPAECALLAGTGTISVARHPATQKITVNGGWGCLMGDEGSGYHIGLNALRHCAEQMDGTDKPDLLSTLILNRECGIPIDREASTVCKARDEVFRAVSPLDRKKIASYTRIVTACCEQQDPFCLTLMREAGNDMASIVARSLDKLELKQAEGILITGGLIHARAFWKEAFEQRLTAHYRINKFHYIPNGIMLGTKIIAEEIMKKC